MHHNSSNKDIASFFESSKYHMADISRKVATFRRAVATGRIYVGEVGFSCIKNNELPKGDVLKLAEIAGVQGAKNTWQHIPMCHPLLLDNVAIHLEPDESSHSIIVYSLVSTTSKTGVEMEALSAVNAALLTIYDLTKPVEPAMSISDIRLLVKEGGKKGLWIHPDGIPEAMQKFFPKESQRILEGRTAAVITLSDRAYSGEYEDISGTTLKKILEDLGCKIVGYKVLPDEETLLEKELSSLVGKAELIVTTGGTGLAPRDITPETVTKLANMEVAGIGELLRSHSAPHVVTSWLSRSLGAVIDDSLVICLAGSTGAVKDSMEALKPIISHALDHIQGKKNAH